MRKFTRTEKVEVLTPEQHQAVEDELKRVGKTSATQLSEAERQSLKVAIAQTDNSC